MRLRSWLVVGVSVALLLAIGGVGIAVNRSALRAAETVHRADSLALATNTGGLAAQVLLVSAKELNDFATSHPLSMTAGDSGDTGALQGYARKSSCFTYGLVLTDLTGNPLNATAAGGSFPDPLSAAFKPLISALAMGQPGFSSVMTVHSTRLAHDAHHDPLTGLPNRRRLQQRLADSRQAEPVAVLFVDLDGFKPVNDELGHQAGDELLRQVGERLSACLRPIDVLARVGGDEFVLLLPGVGTEDETRAVIARLRAAADAPFEIGDQEVRIGASIARGQEPARPPRAASRLTSRLLVDGYL
ncbi:GGDEF domain-containing protein [Dactylosporangium sp. NPDC049140]|uniref:GGDEF domain-containing protein n=1 Tax=Dactylosporangium sp. NPDC049140 TaxID=3155647 RepID=UPI0034046398